MGVGVMDHIQIVRTLTFLLWKISLEHSIVNISFPTQFPGYFFLEPREPVGARADLIRTGTAGTLGNGPSKFDAYVLQLSN